jgi:chromosome segregation ATPase
MEPTSKQVINSCNFINIYQDPDGESTMLTLKNDDDVFEIEIKGHESYEAFHRLIFNDHNCNEVRKKNQELADEIIVLNKRYARAHEKYVELNEKVDILLKELEQVIREKNRLKEEKEKLEEINKNLKKHVQYHIDDKDNIIKRKDELSKENYELKKRYDCLNRKFNRVILNRMSPMIENFADEEPADNVNHPSHYTGKYECIDVMQDVFGDEATNDFCLCNAFKYIWRARKKNGLEDVKKAVWYLNKYIEEEEKYGQDKSITGA